MNGNSRCGRILRRVSAGARHILVVVGVSLACAVSSQSNADDVPPCGISVLPGGEEGGGYALGLIADNEARKQECLSQLEPYLSASAIKLLPSRQPSVSISSSTARVQCLVKFGGSCVQMVVDPSRCNC